MTILRRRSAFAAFAAGTLFFACSEAEPGATGPIPSPGETVPPTGAIGPANPQLGIDPATQIPIAPATVPGAPADPAVTPSTPPEVTAPAQAPQAPAPVVEPVDPAAPPVTTPAPMVSPVAVPSPVSPPVEVPAPIEPMPPAGPPATVSPPAMEPSAPVMAPIPEPPVVPPVAEPAGDPLLGGLTEEQAMERYYFRQEGGSQVVVEGEHFVSQAYCDSDVYRGKRWWMVHTVDFQPKGTPEFAQRCEEARQELMNMDMDVDGDKNIADICSAGRGVQFPIWDERRSTNNESANGKSANEVFEEWGCDPRDANRSSEASGGSYVKLLPDMLYLNHNAIPHTMSNWHNNPFQAPKAYYRINFAEGGRYQIRARAMRGGTDSGDMWLTVARRPGMEPNGNNQNWARVAGLEGDFGWVDAGTHTVEAGEFYIVIAGREDGFFFDKMVISQGGCQGCGRDKDSPAESPTMNE